MASRWIACISMAGALLLSANTALAYVCFLHAPPTVYHDALEAAERVHHARAVFTGEVTALTWDAVTFKVDRVWKGSLGAELTMSRGHEGGIDAERPEFEAGKRYLVFAYGESNASMRASACDWTGELPMAAYTLPLLDSLPKPLAEVTAASRTYVDLAGVARRFFDAIARADKTSLVNMTNPEARDLIREDLLNPRSELSRILLTDPDAMYLRLRGIHNPRFVVLEHPDFVEQWAIVCAVDPARRFALPRTMDDLLPPPESTPLCVSFIRSNGEWIPTYDFAYPAWNPPQGPSRPPKI